MQKELLGCWGIFSTAAVESVHPEDVPVFKSNWNAQARSVFKVLANEEGFLLLGCDRFQFRGRAEKFFPLEVQPLFPPGTRVKIKGLPAQASVYRLDWQSKRREYIFFLEVGGKKSGRWYFLDELEAC